MNVDKNIRLIFSQSGTKLVRVLHDYEIWDDNWRPGLPQVHPLFPNHFAWFRKPWQLLTRDYVDPRIDNQSLTAVFTGRRFLNNGQGFGMPGDPRNNYFSGDIGYVDDPKSENLTTGGSVHLVRFDGERVYFLNMFDEEDIPPTSAELDLQPWNRIVCSSCDGKHQPRRFPQGEQPNGEVIPIVLPWFTNCSRFPMQYTDAWRVAEWKQSWLPDPFTIYGRRSPLLHHG